MGFAWCSYHKKTEFSVVRTSTQHVTLAEYEIGPNSVYFLPALESYNKTDTYKLLMIKSSVLFWMLNIELITLIVL